MKGVMRFKKKRKLSTRYVGPYEVLQRVVNVSYKFRLLSELALVHLVFHDPMLMNCIGDLVSILHIKGLGVDEYISYE